MYKFIPLLILSLQVVALDSQLLTIAKKGSATELTDIIANHKGDTFYFINDFDEFGIPLLNHVVLANNVENAEILLLAGADVNIFDNHLWTPLIVATTYGYQDMVQLLLEYGARVHWQDSDGLNILEQAKQKNNREILYLLLKHSPNYGITLAELRKRTDAFIATNSPTKTIPMLNNSEYFADFISDYEQFVDDNDSLLLQVIDDNKKDMDIDDYISLLATAKQQMKPILPHWFYYFTLAKILQNDNFFNANHQEQDIKQQLKIINYLAPRQELLSNLIVENSPRATGHTQANMDIAYLLSRYNKNTNLYKLYKKRLLDIYNAVKNDIKYYKFTNIIKILSNNTVDNQLKERVQTYYENLKQQNTVQTYQITLVDITRNIQILIDLDIKAKQGDKIIAATSNNLDAFYQNLITLDNKQQIINTILHFYGLTQQDITSIKVEKLIIGNAYFE